MPYERSGNSSRFNVALLRVCIPLLLIAWSHTSLGWICDTVIQQQRTSRSLRWFCWPRGCIGILTGCIALLIFWCRQSGIESTAWPFLFKSFFIDTDNHADDLLFFVTNSPGVDVNSKTLSTSGMHCTTILSCKFIGEHFLCTSHSMQAKVQAIFSVLSAECYIRVI